MADDFALVVSRSCLGLLIAGAVVVAAPARAAVIGAMTAAEPITEARIAGLPPAERTVWAAYLKRSQDQMRADKAALAAEVASGKRAPAFTKPGEPDDSLSLTRDAAWYASADARHIADVVVSFQTPAGGWSKNVSRKGALRQPGQPYAEGGWSYVGTLDNDATTTEIRFLARVASAEPGPAGDLWRSAALKGVRYLLNAQFPNGGWPQVWPLQGGYHDAITFNDDALAHAATLLDDVGQGKGDFAFVGEALRRDATAAAHRAQAVILATQVIANGQRTGWGQQHDALTLAPVGARNFEPAAYSSAETVGILTFLLGRPSLNGDAIRALNGAVKWLETSALPDLEWTSARELVAKPGAAPLWARYYSLETGKPIFGDRDKAIHDDVAGISAERRTGYAWFTTAPARIIARYRNSRAVSPPGPPAVIRPEG